MTERPEPQGDDRRREGPSKPRPTPVRAEASDPKERKKPTPVRELAAVDAPPPPAEPDLEEAEVTVDGVEWIVRVVGRAGGAAASATPLLLLGFWRAEEPEGERVRETLRVGRTLSDLSPLELEDALEASEAPPEPPPEGRSGGGTRGRRRGGREPREGQ